MATDEEFENADAFDDEEQDDDLDLEDLDLDELADDEEDLDDDEADTDIVADDDLVADDAEDDEELEDEELEDEDLDEEIEDEESLDALLRDKSRDEDLLRLDEPQDGLGAPTLPISDGEFTCRSCFLVKRRAQLADEKKMICLDCA